MTGIIEDKEHSEVEDVVRQLQDSGIRIQLISRGAGFFGRLLGRQGRSVWRVEWFPVMKTKETT